MDEFTVEYKGDYGNGDFGLAVETKGQYTSCMLYAIAEDLLARITQIDDENGHTCSSPLAAKLRKAGLSKDDFQVIAKSSGDSQ